MIASVSARHDKDARKGLEVEVFVRSVAERVAAASGLDFVDLEVKRGGHGPIVRIFMDKPGRISLDELENASREISAILDVEDPVGRSYTLEVSSPGIDRPLKKEADFERFAGSEITLKLRLPVDGRRNFSGVLQGVHQGKVRLQIDSGELVFDLITTSRCTTDSTAAKIFRFKPIFSVAASSIQSASAMLS